MCIMYVGVSCIHVICVCVHITHILCNILYAYISLSSLVGICTQVCMLLVSAYYICICLCVCMHTSLCECMHACTGTCVFVCLHHYQCKLVCVCKLQNWQCAHVTRICYHPLQSHDAFCFNR